MFTHVPDVSVILVQTGIYMEVDVYQYNQRLYGQLSKNRFVALRRDYFTSHIKIMWKDIHGMEYRIDMQSGAVYC